MYYSLDIYDALSGRWDNWQTWDQLQPAKDEFERLIKLNKYCMVRECRDLTSGDKWL